MAARTAVARSTRSPPDEALLVAIARGDATALAALYDRYAAATLALLVRIVGSRARAEELLQDVFLQVWRRSRDFASARGSAAAWLFTVARHRALDVVRSADARHTDDAVDGGDAGDVRDALDAALPDDQAALAERGRAVRTALVRLSPLQRRAIELAYFDGLSHSEIAERLGEPLGTVKSRIGGAMAKLRAALARHA